MHLGHNLLLHRVCLSHHKSKKLLAKGGESCRRPLEGSKGPPLNPCWGPVGESSTTSVSGIVIGRAKKTSDPTRECSVTRTTYSDFSPCVRAKACYHMGQGTSRVQLPNACGSCRVQTRKHQSVYTVTFMYGSTPRFNLPLSFVCPRRLLPPPPFKYSNAAQHTHLLSANAKKALRGFGDPPPKRE